MIHIHKKYERSKYFKIISDLNIVINSKPQIIRKNEKYTTNTHCKSTGNLKNLICYIIMLIIDTATLKKTAQNYYINGIILTTITMAIFTEGGIALSSLLIVLVSILIYAAIEKIKIGKRKGKKVEIGNNLKIGYSVAVANVSILILALIMNKFFI